MKIYYQSPNGQVKRARINICLLTLVSFILRCPKFLDIQISYTTLVSGEQLLTVTWVYLYDEQAYTYIVTGESLDHRIQSLSSANHDQGYKKTMISPGRPCSFQIFKTFCCDIRKRSGYFHPNSVAPKLWARFNFRS